MKNFTFLVQVIQLDELTLMLIERRVPWRLDKGLKFVVEAFNKMSKALP